MVWINTTDAAALTPWTPQQIGALARMGLVRRRILTGRTMVWKADVLDMASLAGRKETGGRQGEA